VPNQNRCRRFARPPKPPPHNGPELAAPAYAGLKPLNNYLPQAEVSRLQSAAPQSPKAN
jgi:hypothetical protein